MKPTSKPPATSECGCDDCSLGEFDRREKCSIIFRDHDNREEIVENQQASNSLRLLGEERYGHKGFDLVSCGPGVLYFQVNPSPLKLVGSPSA